MKILSILLDQTPRGGTFNFKGSPTAGSPGPREVVFSNLRSGDIEIKTDSGAGIIIPKSKRAELAQFLATAE